MKPMKLLQTDGSAEIEVRSSDCESIHFYVLHYSKAFNISTGLIAVYDQDFTSCDYKSTLFLESRDLICRLTMWLSTKL